MKLTYFNDMISYMIPVLTTLVIDNFHQGNSVKVSAERQKIKRCSAHKKTKDSKQKSKTVLQAMFDMVWCRYVAIKD